MKARIKKYIDSSPLEFLVLRERLVLKRYRKMSGRDPEKRKLLITLALQKIKEKEKDDFNLLGYRRRKVNIL